MPQSPCSPRTGRILGRVPQDILCPFMYHSHVPAPGHWSLSFWRLSVLSTDVQLNNLFLSVNLSASHSVWMCVCVLLLLLFGLYSGTVLLQIESDFIGEFKRIRGQQNRPSQMATSSHLTIVLCGTCMPGKNWSQSKHNMRGHLLWKHCIRMPQPSRDYR